MEEYINYELGWTTLKYEKGKEQGYALYHGEGNCTFWDSIFNNSYRNLFDFYLNEQHCLYYQLKSSWYITEISEVLANCLPFYDKIIIETPDFSKVEEKSFQGEYQPFVFGYYKDKICESFNTARCNFTFFDSNSLLEIKNTFKDAIENKEIILLPNLHPWGNEDKGMDYNEYGDYMQHLESTHRQLFKSPKLGFFENETQVNENDQLVFPFLKCDNPYYLIQFRRDEFEYFNRFRDYSKKIIESKNFSQSELIQYIEESYKEYNEKLTTLKRKGFLTRIGATVYPIAATFGLEIDGNMISRSGILMTISSTAMLMRTVIDQYKAEKDMKKDSFHFLRMAKKVGIW